MNPDVRPIKSWPRVTNWVSLNVTLRGRRWVTKSQRVGLCNDTWMRRCFMEWARAMIVHDSENKLAGRKTWKPLALFAETLPMFDSPSEFICFLRTGSFVGIFSWANKKSICTVRSPIGPRLFKSLEKFIASRSLRIKSGCQVVRANCIIEFSRRSSHGRPFSKTRLFN